MAQFILKNIDKQFIHNSTPVPVLTDINVHLDSATCYGLMGVSGSGKSTLVHLLAGLDTPTRGTICFNNVCIDQFSVKQKQQFLLTQIGLLFQSPYLLPDLSVLENVMLKAFILGLSQSESRKRGYELLQIMGLTDKAHTAPRLLSGGEQQRVALARALFTRPAFLLADEPTAHLDESTRDQVLTLLLDCTRDWGMGLIIATHDPYIAARLTTVYELKGQRLELKSTL